MPLSCLGLFEAGQFGSDSGNVIVPSAAIPFPIVAYAVGTSSGAATCTANGGNAVGSSSGTATVLGHS